jgi:hypothetical protein
MKLWMQKLTLLLVIVGLLLLVAGCGKKVDEAQIQQDITEGVNSFKTAVQAYNVANMLGFLVKDVSFKLTISEGTGSYDKNYATLKTELEEDQEKQLHWRQSPPEGHGYVLIMDLGTIIFSNTSASGAIATVPFKIKELAQEPEIPQDVTDEGQIVCEMVNLQETWRCQKMTIVYYVSDKTSAGAHSTKTGEDVAQGFCFGRFGLE